MALSVLERPEVLAEPDPSAGAWDVDVGPDRYRIREWTWGERRRLVDACVTGPIFHRELFVSRLVRLLVSPPPPEEEAPILAAVALRLLGVDPENRPASLLSSEATLAVTWGWGPAELDRQPAPRIDQHLAGLTPSTVEASGWNTIMVEDG